MGLSQIKQKLSNVGYWLHLARLARERSGKRIVSQILEVAKLRFSKPKIRVREYYEYGLYDDSRFSYEAKRQFIGTRIAKKLYRLSNHRGWIGISDDKLIFYALLKSLGLPFPKLYAIFHPRGRFFGDIPCFIDAKSLAGFLRHEIPYPFFCKPVRGSHGKGASAIVGFDKDLDRLRLANQEEVTVDRYISQLPENSRLSNSRFGHLFQEVLNPHPEVLEICGNTVSSIRAVVLLCSNGPQIIRAVWKIPSGTNMTDNFQHGLSGNLLGAINTQSGRIQRVINGVGPAQSEVAVHPDTHKPLIGIKLPNWSEIVDVCLAGATALPGLCWQNWDIAMCPGGPVILELNAIADLDIAQHAYGNGLYDAYLQNCLTQLARG